jgi:hypothetical protein
MLFVGLLLVVWAAPRMTAGHFQLASGFTVYVLIGMRYEHHDFVRHFGAPYANGRAQVRV